MRFPLAALACAAAALIAGAADPPANAWRKVAENQVGPRAHAPLVHLPGGGFTVLGGYVRHDHRGDRPYDVQAFDEATATWKNVLPEAAKERGKETSAVREPGFGTPYFATADKDGLARIHPQQSRFDNQFALAPWDGCVYALVCGHTVKYDPKARAWTDLAPKTAPAPVEKSFHDSLCWGRCAPTR